MVVAGLCAAALPAVAGAKNRLSVVATPWRTQLRLEVDFAGPPPAWLCTPELRPPPLCDDEAGVSGALRVQAYMAGRLLYDEIDRSPPRDGFLEWRLPYARLAVELGRCAPGRYFWKVVLYDGWGRRPLDISRRGSVPLHCNRGQLVHGR